MTAPTSWEQRVHRSVVIGQFVALIVAIISDIVSNGASGASVLAAAIGSVYALGSAAIPESWYRRRLGVESITLAGAFLTIIAITLTGGAASPYLLLSMGPPMCLQLPYP